MITRTMTVTCDIPACTTRVEMDPDDIHPYRTLNLMGWRFENYPTQILTICPERHDPT